MHAFAYTAAFDAAFGGEPNHGKCLSFSTQPKMLNVLRSLLPRYKAVTRLDFRGTPIPATRVDIACGVSVRSCRGVPPFRTSHAPHSYRSLHLGARQVVPGTVCVRSLSVRIFASFISLRKGVCPTQIRQNPASSPQCPLVRSIFCISFWTNLVGAANGPLKLRRHSKGLPPATGGLLGVGLCTLWFPRAVKRGQA